MQGSGATPASTISDSSQNKKQDFPLLFHSFALTLDKLGCTRKYKEKQDFPLLFHSFALTLDKLGCTRKYKEKQDFPLLFHSFALTLDKLGCVSDEQKQKKTYFCFVLRSTCTNFR